MVLEHGKRERELAAADVVEEHVDALARGLLEMLRERGIAVVDRGVGAQHSYGVLGAMPSARDGHDARARGLGELDRHATHGAGGGADEHGVASPPGSSAGPGRRCRTMTSAWLGTDMSKIFACGPESAGVAGCLIIPR